MPQEVAQAKTAFVFAGGGSFGAIQVGMLRSVARRNIAADMVVGSSVGALNEAYYVAIPRLKDPMAGGDLAWIVLARRLSVHMENHDRVHVPSRLSGDVGPAPPTRRGKGLRVATNVNEVDPTVWIIRRHEAASVSTSVRSAKARRDARPKGRPDGRRHASVNCRSTRRWSSLS